MRLEQFKIGLEFLMSGNRYRCTDVGTRIVVAIKIDPEATIDQVSYRNGYKEVIKTKIGDDKSWYDGPPYAVSEIIIDENDMKVCEHEPYSNL